MKYDKNHKRVLVSISGPSGSGKTTLARNMQQRGETSGLAFLPVISATTRPIRAGERDGHDYYFVTDYEFDAQASDPSNVVEQIAFNGYRYALFKPELDRVWATGAVPCVILDPQGVKMARDYCDKHKVIFLPLYLGARLEVLYKRYLERMISDPNIETNVKYHIKRLAQIERESVEWLGEFNRLLNSANETRPQLYANDYSENSQEIEEHFTESIKSVVAFADSNLIDSAEEQQPLDFYKVQRQVIEWATSAFPTRDINTIIRKLCLNEAPELTIELANMNVGGIARESADVMILLMDLCDQLGIDLLAEVMDKLRVNQQREWRTDALGVSHHVDKV